ncbi:hypothetical protein AWV79_07610 [Cupriavidus sp. UYMMa02A]|nr:hypothetical protein AWV79_07610 [Cupriavidus sp. UYMMa02A]
MAAFATVTQTTHARELTKAKVVAFKMHLLEKRSAATAQKKMALWLPFSSLRSATIDSSIHRSTGCR